jgi:hypothetical protein
MQRREFDCATIGVENRMDISGRATGGETDRALRIGKGRKLRHIACSSFLGSLMVAGLFIVLPSLPARSDEDKDIHHGRVDNDKEIRAEIAALLAQVESLHSTVSALESQVNTLHAGNTTLQNEINSLQTSNTTLHSQLVAVQSNHALLLGPFVNVDPNPEIGVIGPNIIFSGANIHIVSGSGNTGDNSNALGLGNLIIGYDDDPQNLNAGLGGGPPLRSGDRGGSHNLIIGGGNRFTVAAIGGLVAGELNTINALGASVTGGRLNTASGGDASVNGGIFNTASGAQSTVSGGVRNTASGNPASVSGGLFNTAGGEGTVVIGGQGVVDNIDGSIAPQPPFP